MDRRGENLRRALGQCLHAIPMVRVPVQVGDLEALLGEVLRCPGVIVEDAESRGMAAHGVVLGSLRVEVDLRCQAVSLDLLDQHAGALEHDRGRLTLQHRISVRRVLPCEYLVDVLRGMHRL